MGTWRQGWSYVLNAEQTNLDQSIYCDRIRELAERGLNYPTMIDVSEIQELCGAIARHYSNVRTPLFTGETLINELS